MSLIRLNIWECNRNLDLKLIQNIQLKASKFGGFASFIKIQISGSKILTKYICMSADYDCFK